MRPFARILPFLVLVGCLDNVNGRGAARPVVLMHAEKDLDCPSEDIRVSEEFGGVYKAVGCGRKAYYQTLCEHLSCEVKGEGDGPVGWKDRPDQNTPVLPR
ncbi:hypothetical protein [Polyangium jinanense]|uniref:Uncharacterized protein n=1 Tax=Polyangium jinanense TaxID=2829994 RepID=A0A9X3WYW0_9BACT|nr:hypothetical protein [Polyangium jinanense]MDC3954526.1 hypothetical protein [Polyangium jinanense]MDC3980829.1 hypothetical protein [Polyangium jinanense]